MESLKSSGTQQTKSIAQTAKAGKSLPAVPVQQEPIQQKNQEPIQEVLVAYPQTPFTPLQMKANNTGLPDNLKSGIEALGGYDMSDVKVHYNSAKPATLQAHAYAQGSDIHIGPGQERHLPHEAWHVVQQKQGRVQATKQMKGDVPVNDDKGLEHEADVMGAKSLQTQSANVTSLKSTTAMGAVQRVTDEGLRPETDGEIDALKERTKLILGQLSVKGADLKGKYGQQAQEVVEKKTKKVLNNEKGESLEAQIAKKIWSKLTAQEKFDIIVEGGKKIFSGFAEIIDALPEGEKSAPKEKSKKKESSGSLLPDMPKLPDLTAEDMEMAYDFLKARRDINNKIEEAKKEIISTLGSAGKAVGKTVGEIGDEMEFKKLVLKLTPEFEGARAKLTDVIAKIVANKDIVRYNDELAVLQSALSKLTGPRIAIMLGGEIKTEARLAYPDICEKAIEEIQGVARNTRDIVIENPTVWERFLGTDTKNAPAADPKVAVAQEQASSALKHVIQEDWGAVTTLWSVPDGVKAIRKLDLGLGGSEYLTAAKVKGDAVGGAGKNRHDITKAFYAAVQDIDVNDAAKLNLATAAFKKVETDLKAPKKK